MSLRPVPPPGGFTTSYATVVAALVRMHEIPPEGVLAWRARFGGFQRDGLFGPENQPGKGRRLNYATPDVFHRAVLAFELTQAGIAPRTIVRLVKDYWESKLRAIFSKAEDALIHPAPRNSNDVALVMTGIALAAETAVPNINYVTVDKIAQRLDLALRDTPARILVINLSAQLRAFHDALADAYKQEITPHHIASKSAGESERKRKK
jgi:hypothetical protein